MTPAVDALRPLSFHRAAQLTVLLTSIEERVRCTWWDQPGVVGRLVRGYHARLVRIRRRIVARLAVRELQPRPDGWSL